MTVLAIAAALAPYAFRLAEKMLGPKTGNAKMEAATNIVMPAIEAAAAAGKLIEGGAPTKDVIKDILEKLFAVEKAKPDWQDAATLDWSGRKFNVMIIGEVK